MFLAPTGNPSSLRVGHPDVATEHTGLSPASLPPPVVRGGVQLRSRDANCGYSLWEECAGTGRGNTRVGHRRQLAGKLGLAVGYGGGSVGTSRHFLRAHRERVCVNPCARTAQLYLPEATSGCPSSARAGAPVGAKEVYSGPSTRTSKSLKIVQLSAQLCYSGHRN